jgi:hypothetical protein
VASVLGSHLQPLRCWGPPWPACPALSTFPQLQGAECSGCPSQPLTPVGLQQVCSGLLCPPAVTAPVSWDAFCPLPTISILDILTRVSELRKTLDWASGQQGVFSPSGLFHSQVARSFQEAKSLYPEAERLARIFL